MKTITLATAAAAIAFAVAPIASMAEPAASASTVVATTVMTTASTAMPQTAAVRRAKRLASDDRIRQQQDYDQMYSH